MEAVLLFKRNYLDGIWKNAIAVKTIYPGWRMRLYTDIPHLVSNVTTSEILDVCDVRSNPMLGNLQNVSGTLWRFLPLLDCQVETVLFRDLDSLPSLRETSAVRVRNTHFDK